jgi:O-antigen ligase
MIALLLLAAVPAVVAFVLWTLVDLERFVLFAVLTAMIYPASLAKPAGTNIAIVDVFLLLAIGSWLINSALRNAPSPYVRGNPLLWPALLLVTINWTSLAWSTDPHRTFAFGIQSIELVIVFPLVFASLPRSTEMIYKGLLVLIAGTSVMAIALLARYGASATARISGTYLPGLNKNAAGSFQAAGAILAYVLQMRKRGKFRGWLVGAVVLNVAGLLATGSRGGMLGAAVGIVSVTVLLKRRKAMGIGIVALIVATYLTVLAPAIATKTSVSGSTNTSELRVVLWKDAIKQIESRPVFGSGARTYYDFKYDQQDPNNLFLLTWAEEGLPGMAALIWLLVSFIRLLRRARRLPLDTAILCFAVGGVAISLLAHFQVDVSWARGATSLLFAAMGLLVGLFRLAAVETPPPPGPPVDASQSPSRVLARSG